MRINVGPWRTTVLRAEHRTDIAGGDTEQWKWALTVGPVTVTRCAEPSNRGLYMWQCDEVKAGGRTLRGAPVT
jgi:hypothetical protein